MTLEFIVTLSTGSRRCALHCISFNSRVLHLDHSKLPE
jgi:hypothetical protein